jgi:hypothetical protein
MASNQLPIADSQFCTEVATFEHTTTWTIKRFLLLVESSKKNQNILESPKFEIKVVNGDGKPSTTVWFFRCFPGGDGEEGTDHVSLYLYLSSLGQLKAKSIQAEVKLGLENNTISRKSIKEWKLSDNWGYFKFISHAQLTSKPGNYLTDDSFIIRCKITLGPLSYPSKPAVPDPLLNKLSAVKATAQDLQAVLWTRNNLLPIRIELRSGEKAILFSNVQYSMKSTTTETTYDCLLYSFHGLKVRSDSRCDQQGCGSALMLLWVIRSRVRIRITSMRIRIHLFIVMQIRICLFT